MRRKSPSLWGRVRKSRRAAHRQVVHLQRWLAHANRQALALFTADAHAVIQLHRSLPDQRSAACGFNTGANQRRTFNAGHGSSLDQIRF